MPLINLEKELEKEKQEFEFTLQQQKEIIDKSRVLDKLKDGQKSTLDQQDVIYCILITILLTFNHLFFDFLVLKQFDYIQQFDRKFVYNRVGNTSLLLLTLTIVTQYFKANKVFQVALIPISVFTGLTVVYNVTQDETFGAYQQTPGLITVGILFIIQMDLPFACFSILICVGYATRHLFLTNGNLGGKMDEL